MNIYDIAKEAHVSTATVSRVINNSPYISEITREQVQRILDKYSYVPSAIARGLVSNSLNMIGVLIESMGDLYHTNTAFIIENELRKKSYQCIITQAEKHMENHLQILSQKHLDGLVLIGSFFATEKMSDAINTLFPSKPVVLVNGYMQRDNIYCVICDDAFGTGLAVEHLYRKGRRNIVYVDCSVTPSARHKLNGYQTEIHKCFFSQQQEYTVSTANSFEGGLKAAKYIIECMPHFDGVICGQDIVAMGVIYHLKKFGYRIPEDVSVIGYDNSIYGKLSDPFLSSIDNKMEYRATKAAQILLQALSGDTPSNIVNIQPTLYIGGTS